MAESSSLLKSCPGKLGPWVRIPASPILLSLMKVKSDAVIRYYGAGCRNPACRQAGMCFGGAFLCRGTFRWLRRKRKILSC